MMFKKLSTERISTGCTPLDNLMNGGIEVGVITEIYGEGGSGKTNFCIQLARNIARTGKKVIYIDTEGLSPERLVQIFGEDLEKIMNNILIFSSSTMPEQEEAVDKCISIIENDKNDKEPAFKLIILDSATSLYRPMLGTEDYTDGRNSLVYQINKLHTIARRKDIAVVITSQVFTNISKKDGDKCPVEPLGGHLLFHSAKAIYRFDRGESGERFATIIKHRSLADGSSASFHITNRGLE